jgi:hypothetical protein
MGVSEWQGLRRGTSQQPRQHACRPLTEGTGGHTAAQPSSHLCMQAGPGLLRGRVTSRRDAAADPFPSLLDTQPRPATLSSPDIQRPKPRSPTEGARANRALLRTIFSCPHLTRR